MDTLYTKNGRPFRVSGTRVFGPNGVQVGSIRNGKVYGGNGGYVATIVRDRLIYRSTDSASISSPFAATIGSLFALGHHTGSADWGDEPPI